MSVFNIFSKKAEPEPVNMIEVKDRCGVMINAGGGDSIWIAFPLWDTSVPIRVNGPDRKISTTIVLNETQEGCLPLVSFLAADKRIAIDNVFVTNSNHLFDWHPSYTKEQQEGISKLVQVKSFSGEITAGDVTLTKKGDDHFVVASFPNPQTGASVMAFVGADIKVENYVEQIKNTRPHIYFIGSFDTEKLAQTFGALDSVLDRLSIWLYLDMEGANLPAENFINAFNSLGFTVTTIGKEKQ